MTPHWLEASIPSGFRRRQSWTKGTQDAYGGGMSNSVKAGLWSALFAFLGVLLPALLGFIGDVADWAGDVDGTFPSVSPLGKAAVAAVAAAVTFLLNFGFRWLQERGNLPGDGPTYGELPPPPPPA